MKESEFTDPETETGSSTRIEYGDILLKQIDTIRRLWNDQNSDAYMAAIEELMIEMYPYIKKNTVFKKESEKLEKEKTIEIKKLKAVFNREIGSKERDHEAENKILIKYYRNLHRSLFILMDDLGLLLEKQIHEVYK